MKRGGRRYNALSFLTREGEDEGFVLRWSETRQLFLEYVDFKKYNPRNAKKMVSYLDRVVKELVKAPLDVMKMFWGLIVRQNHNLNRAFCAWLKCLEINSSDTRFKDFFNGLRATIPKDWSRFLNKCYPSRLAEYILLWLFPSITKNMYQTISKASYNLSKQKKKGVKVFLK